MAGNAGKGSARRPAQVAEEQVAQNWDRIFGKKKEEPRDFNCGLDYSKINEQGVILPSVTVRMKSSD